jgi:hypothetical protein
MPQNNQYSNNQSNSSPPQNEIQTLSTKKEIGCLYIQQQRSKKNHKTLIKIAFCTQNTIQNILKPHSQTSKYGRSGIYKVKCLGNPLEYIGQMGRTLNTRYKENIQAIRNNNSNSGCSNHILNTGHIYSTITDTMDIIRTRRKWKH